MTNSFQLGDSDHFPQSENTKYEASSETTEDEINNIIASLAKEIAQAEAYACYVIGMGARPKAIYTKVEKINDVELIRSRSVLSGIFSWSIPFVASYEGIIKIKSSYILPSIFELVSDSSMAAIYCFSLKYEELILNSLLQAPKGKAYMNLLKEDPSYSMFLVDTDCFESTTGMLKVVSYGFEAPKGVMHCLHT